VTRSGSRGAPQRSRRKTIDVPARGPLRGEAKLRTALRAFDITVDGRVALDVGAAAGGFTRVLLEAGAVKVYAVDAGHGQLLGSLRQDSRVINLEAVNVGHLDTRLVPDEIGVVSIDVSYLSLASAVGQLDRVAFAAGADLIGLVKPMFELRLATAPTDLAVAQSAAERAAAGITAAGWTVLRVVASPVSGARGAREMLLHARRDR
jgi:23S rRNA (cytidine1920-2'-O)/16S rRNA (cytidine1409-2'-O)-methyltransferase